MSANCMATSRGAWPSSCVSHKLSWGRPCRSSGVKALKTNTTVRKSDSLANDAEEGRPSRSPLTSNATYPADRKDSPPSDAPDAPAHVNEFATDDSGENEQSTNVLGRLDDAAPRLNPYFFLDFGSQLQKAALVAAVAALYVYTKESSDLGGLPVFDVVFRLIGVWTVLWGLRTVLLARKQDG